MNNKSVLQLTVTPKCLEAISMDGVESIYRKKSEWILDKLYHKNGKRKEYSHLEISAGRLDGSEKIEVEYQGFEILKEDKGRVKYQNGYSQKNIRKGDIAIKIVYL